VPINIQTHNIQTTTKMVEMKLAMMNEPINQSINRQTKNQIKLMPKKLQQRFNGR
jgi:hypothetical protein